MLIVQNLLAFAFGPLLIGVVSDALTSAYGADALRYALALMLAAAIAAALMLWLARRSIGAGLTLSRDAGGGYPAAMTIRIGIGGWTYEPWRGTFFPDKWPHKRELEYAAGRLTAIEVNGTYYSGFKPATFANWREQTPDGFVFTLKASRYCTNRKVLAEAGESIARFTGQGIIELGDKLGPILWQFMATKRFDHDDFAAFLKLLPANQDGIALRHAVQVRHESFADPTFVAMCRAAGVAIVFADSADYPAIADVTGDFVYARLEAAEERFVAGYAPAALDGWAEAAKTWAAGGRPEGLAYVEDSASPERVRDTFVFFINGAKVRAPQGALALIERVQG